MPRRGPPRSSTTQIKKRVGEQLRALRSAQGLSQSELGRRASTSASQIHSIESGTRAPNVVSLVQIAKALGVPVAKLFTNESAPAPPSRTEKAWYRLIGHLRTKSVEELRAIESIVLAYEAAVERGRRTTPS